MRILTLAAAAAAALILSAGVANAAPHYQVTGQIAGTDGGFAPATA